MTTVNCDLEVAKVGVVGGPAFGASRRIRPPRPPAECRIFQNVDRPHVADVAHPVVGQDDDGIVGQAEGFRELPLEPALAAVNVQGTVEVAAAVDDALGQVIVRLNQELKPPGVVRVRFTVRAPALKAEQRGLVNDSAVNLSQGDEQLRQVFVKQARFGRREVGSV